MVSLFILVTIGLPIIGYAFDVVLVGPLTHLCLTWLCIAWALRSERDILSPVWLLALTLFPYVAARVILFSLGLVPVRLFNVFPFELNSHGLYFLNLIVLFAFGAYVLGYRQTKPWARAVARSLPVLVASQKRMRADIMLAGCACVSAAAFLYLKVTIGEGIGSASTASKIGESYAHKLAWIAFNLFFVGSAYYVVANRVNIRWVAINLAFLMAAFTVGRRSTLLWWFVPLLAVFHYRYRRIRVSTGLIGYGLILILMIGLVFLRVASYMTSAQSDEIFSSLAEFFLWDSNYYLIERIAEKWGAVGLIFYGHPGFGFTLDEPIGARFSELYVPSFRAGIPLTIIGSSLAQGGILGLFLICYFVGFVSQVFHSYLCVRSNSGYVVVIYSLFLCTLFFGIRLGDWGLVIANASRYWIAALLIGFWVAGSKLRMFYIEK